VIELLNDYFIPASLSNEDYNQGGAAPPAEKALREQIARETRDNLHMPSAEAPDVAGYILGPDGRVLSTLRLPDLADTAKMFDWLSSARSQLKTVKGAALFKPQSRSAPPRAGADDLVLHLTTRYLSARAFPSGEGAEFDRWNAMIGNRLRAGSLVPTDDWIVLTKAQWSHLLPPGNTKLGDTWTIDADTAKAFLKHFGPATTNIDLARRRFDDLELKATLVAVKDGVAQARLEGKFKMWYPFIHYVDDNYFVEATLIGYLDYDPAKRRISALRLVTDTASYLGQDFGAALRSVPSKTTTRATSQR
jgi:hypothetical protein